MVGFMGMETMGAMMRAAKLKRKEAEDLHQVSHDFSDFSLSSTARKIRRLRKEAEDLHQVSHDFSDFSLSYPARKIRRLRKEAEDLHQVSHDFSDFSLSSPARKIRRLDAELPSILEEEEPEVISFLSSMATGRGTSGPLIEEFDSVPDPLPNHNHNHNHNHIHDHRDPHPHDDKDKAIVLVKPLNSPIFHNSPNISLSLDSNFISGFNDLLIRGTSNQKRSNRDDIAAWNECLAVVPWVPPYQLIPPTSGTEASQIPAEAPLEEDTMEIEDDSNNNAPQLVQQGI